MSTEIELASKVFGKRISMELDCRRNTTFIGRSESDVKIFRTGRCRHVDRLCDVMMNFLLQVDIRNTSDDKLFVIACAGLLFDFQLMTSIFKI